MKDILLIIQIIITVALSVCILLQAQGAGLGGTFGESSETYRSKRGVEQLLFRTTIVLAALFIIASVINLLLK